LIFAGDAQVHRQQYFTDTTRGCESFIPLA
jgi:hypothetical protein